MVFVMDVLLSVVIAALIGAKGIHIWKRKDLPVTPARILMTLGALALALGFLLEALGETNWGFEVGNHYDLATKGIGLLLAMIAALLAKIGNEKWFQGDNN